VDLRRVEIYREARRHKKKYCLSLFLIFCILILGIIGVDYSTNRLMKDEKSISILSVRNIQDSYIEICIMNRSIYINTVFIRRDIQRLEEVLREFFKKWRFFRQAAYDPCHAVPDKIILSTLTIMCYNKQGHILIH
jgi:hypothetical protein